MPQVKALIPPVARPLARRVRTGVLVVSGLLLYVVLIVGLAIETRLLRPRRSRRDTGTG